MSALANSQRCREAALEVLGSAAPKLRLPDLEMNKPRSRSVNGAIDGGRRSTLPAPDEVAAMRFDVPAALLGSKRYGLQVGAEATRLPVGYEVVGRQRARIPEALDYIQHRIPAEAVVIAGVSNGYPYDLLVAHFHPERQVGVAAPGIVRSYSAGYLHDSASPDIRVVKPGEPGMLRYPPVE